MKAFYTIVLSCFCIGFSWSQNTSDIASLEYYFDQDPGVGLGTSIDINPDTEVIDQSFNISTTGLLEGTHKLFIRAINADGEASLMESKTFRITPTPDNNSSDIVEAEYFFNQDPGVGNGTAIDLTDAETIDEVLSVSTSGLPSGTHRLFVRVKNSNDEYSLYENKTFRVAPTPDDNDSDIVEAEYFFNQDPGVGNGTAIDLTDAETIDEVLSVSTSGLPSGTHRLFVRVKNSNDEYSLYENKTFRVAPTPDDNDSDIVEAEYFFNQDPGVGNGTAIDLMDAETIDEALSVSTSGLPTGTHRLFVRVKNSNDEYSLYEHKIFRVAPVSDINTASITAAEYYIDVDPGVGNGTTISVTGDSIDEVLSIPTTVGLAQGDHYLHIRVRNTDGTWSLYERQFFEVDGTLGITNETLSEIRIYPIPSATSVNIKTPNHVEITNIKLIDMYGKVIITTNGNLNKLDVSTLPKGTYLLQLITNEGNLSKRIIKN